MDYSVYLVTDRSLATAPTLEAAVDAAISGGVTLVQLREKNASSLEFFEIAQRVKEVTDRHGIPLIVNDRLDIAQSVDAAGVHVGQDDLPLSVVRRILGPDKIVGVSVGSLAEATIAERDGADYLGVGAMYPTDTKDDADLVSFDELRRIRAATSLPIVVIGGIDARRAADFAGIALDGFAVVSAILARPDIHAAALEIKRAYEENIRPGRC